MREKWLSDVLDSTVKLPPSLPSGIVFVININDYCLNHSNWRSHVFGFGCFEEV